MTVDQAVIDLRTTLVRREPNGVVIVNADPGPQSRNLSFLALPEETELQDLMGRVASAGANAAMERFGALIFHNLLNT